MDKIMNNNIAVQLHSSWCNELMSALATYTTRVLKPNISQGTNTLSQLDFDSRNTKYVIKWDYDLLDGTITIPNNCLIEFDGGSISNGILIGNNTIIITCQKDEDILKNVNLEGTFKINGRSPDLTLSYEDLVVGENEKIVPQYKTVIITDDDGKTISFDTIVPTIQPLNLCTIIINPLDGVLTNLGEDYTENEGIYSLTKEEGNTIMLPTPTRPGYKFLGWNTEQQGSGTTYIGQLNITENLTLYAIWCQLHTVVVYRNYSNEDLTIIHTYNEVEHGSTIILPPSENRQHYTFRGWNTQQSGNGTSFNANSEYQINEDIQFYGNWESIQYTITFNIDGGNGNTPSSISGIYGTQITLPTYSGTKSGFHLTNSWFDGNNSVGNFGENYTIIGNKTLKVKWNIIQHQYLLSTSIPNSIPTWSESDGEQILLKNLIGWNNWKDQNYQYISFPKKNSEEIIDSYFEHLDSYESSLTYLYIKQDNTLSDIITFRFNIMETMVPLGNSNQNNKVRIK